SFDTANLNVVDGWVYYQVVDWDIDKAGDSAGIYKVRVDGSEHMRLTEEHTTIVNVAGDWIYYTGQYGRSIYKMSTDGANQTLLYEGSVSNFNMVDGWIYFVAADAWGNIYRMRTDGSDLERMNNESSGVIFSAGDWLYHSNADDHRKIRKDAPAQALRPREQVSESTVTEDLKQRSLVALGESAFSRISWHFYDKYDAYAEITYTMRLDSDRFDRVIDQAIRELSVLFAELATIPDIDYLIDDLIVEAVHDTNGRVILNIQVDGELLASTDWNNPAVEIIGNISDFDTFTEWWSVERRFFRISVQEEHGTARFIVELFEYNG
ncbi:MAG TPA: DUF5050 domain-containing protein, partial [Bacillota bacterium]|nr:DUF5050 domain-containing protein [Bacillota bacterium]